MRASVVPAARRAARCVRGASSTARRTFVASASSTDADDIAPTRPARAAKEGGGEGVTRQAGRRRETTTRGDDHVRADDERAIGGQLLLLAAGIRQLFSAKCIQNFFTFESTSVSPLVPPPLGVLAHSVGGLTW